MPNPFPFENNLIMLMIAIANTTFTVDLLYPNTATYSKRMTVSKKNTVSLDNTEAKNTVLKNTATLERKSKCITLLYRSF
ncbi:hypothetical protein HMPREF1152_1670 [Mogibacterium sp. CM50]|nr:hypothetical protein HMPREF1152_1670 [Mogibacterium sp. CM50]